jgi:hypothetical protein
LTGKNEFTCCIIRIYLNFELSLVGVLNGLDVLNEYVLPIAYCLLPICLNGLTGPQH